MAEDILKSLEGVALMPVPMLRGAVALASSKEIKKLREEIERLRGLADVIADRIVDEVHLIGLETLDGVQEDIAEIIVDEITPNDSRRSAHREDEPA